MNPAFTPRAALFEILLVTAICLVVFARPSVRTTLRSAPRPLRIGSVLALMVWGVSQVAEIRLATYPFMSWHMYGESRRNAPVVGYRVVGEQCDGEARILPNTGSGMGRRPLLASGLRRAYNDARSAPAGSPEIRAAALVRTDSLLQLVLHTWNGKHRDTPLCAVALEQMLVPASALARQPLPLYETVRRYVRDD